VVGESRVNRTAAIVLAWVISMFALGACGSQPVANPSPAATVVTTTEALNCRLPVAGFVPPAPKGTPDNSIAADGQLNQKGTGGFVDFPSGRYTAAADSDRSYLASAGVWLPVVPQAIAPDQRSYVEGRAPRVSAAPPTTSLYLVDVRTKAERLLFTAPEGDMAPVIAYTAAGVYVETMPSTAAGPSELVLIDPVTGSHQSVPGAEAEAGVVQQTWVAITSDAAWGWVITKPQGTQSQPSFKLVRMSLKDGSLVDWYDTPSAPFLSGFDGNDHPILAAPLQAGSTTLVLVSEPNQKTAIQPKGGSYLTGRGPSLRDPHGVWFGSGDGGIWLYAPAGGFERVAMIPPQPGGTGAEYDPHAWRSIAGPCV
jgi:hypothetical protein